MFAPFVATTTAPRHDAHYAKVMAVSLKSSSSLSRIEQPRPRMDGLDATKIIRREVPESKVIIVSLERSCNRS